MMNTMNKMLLLNAHRITDSGLTNTANLIFEDENTQIMEFRLFWIYRLKGYFNV